MFYFQAKEKPVTISEVTKNGYFSLKLNQKDIKIGDIYMKAKSHEHLGIMFCRGLRLSSSTGTFEKIHPNVMVTWLDLDNNGQITN